VLLDRVEEDRWRGMASPWELLIQIDVADTGRSCQYT
jgi:hypothetical protein